MKLYVRYFAGGMAICAFVTSIVACSFENVNSAYVSFSGISSSFSGSIIKCSKDIESGAIKVVIDQRDNDEEPRYIEFKHKDNMVDVAAHHREYDFSANSLPVTKNGNDFVFEGLSSQGMGTPIKVQGSFRCVDID